MDSVRAHVPLGAWRSLTRVLRVPMESDSGRRALRRDLELLGRADLVALCRERELEERQLRGDDDWLDRFGAMKNRSGVAVVVMRVVRAAVLTQAWLVCEARCLL